MKSPTYFVDVDGVLFKHKGEGPCAQWEPHTTELLPGAREQFNKWEMAGAHIVLVTARKESLRVELEDELRRHGLFWDQLIMGITSGERVIINDVKPDGQDTCRAITIPRNVGLMAVQLEESRYKYGSVRVKADGKYGYVTGVDYTTTPGKPIVSVNVDQTTRSFDMSELEFV